MVEDDAITLVAEMANLEEGTYRIKQLPIPETFVQRQLKFKSATIKI